MTLADDIRTSTALSPKTKAVLIALFDYDRPMFCAVSELLMEDAEGPPVADIRAAGEHLRRRANEIEGMFDSDLDLLRYMTQYAAAIKRGDKSEIKE